ncbi:CC_3452 family protein [Tsuneonella mangrovi]|uniref:CC_3452 family protein n=1 Tax=Tsuneonella mangrovi TaxID=1982042 RepID=UPI0012373DDD|nr:hypothetical protein [Tsuneonella mangrovi]
MTLSLPAATRPLAMIAALGWTVLSFGAALSPAHAAQGPYYQAQLAAPAAKASYISSNLAWSCADTSCVAGRGTSRPEIICGHLAREVGDITAFVANGKALDADQLAKCNG